MVRLLSLDVDVQRWTHQTYRHVFQVKAICRMVIAVKLDDREPHVLQDETTCVLVLREKVLNTSSQLATRCRTALLCGILSERQQALAIQLQMLPDPARNASGVLPNVKWQWEAGR